MARTVSCYLDDIAFLPLCAVCGENAAEVYEASTYLAGYEQTLSIMVPMCDLHNRLANETGQGEYAVGKISLLLGAIGGALLVWKLLSHWADYSILNIGLAALLGIGATVIVWLLGSSFIGPMLAPKAVKVARNAAGITGAWNGDLGIIVRLEFANDLYALEFAALNGVQLEN
jgi:hypothetical protein